MIKEKMKQVGTARLCHSRWKRGCDVIVAAADAAKALKAADAGAAKKAKDDAAAKNVKDDANEEAAAQPGYPGAAHLRSRAANVSGMSKGYEGDEKLEDGSMMQIIEKAMMAIKKTRKSEARKAYQTSCTMSSTLQYNTMRNTIQYNTIQCAIQYNTLG